MPDLIILLPVSPNLPAILLQARGKIVVYNVEFVDYLTTSEYRKNGAAEAAKVGAIASLTRSVGPLSLDTPHTGGTTYVDGVRKIPAASITIEDAEMFQRLQNKGSYYFVQYMGKRHH